MPVGATVRLAKAVTLSAVWERLHATMEPDVPPTFHAKPAVAPVGLIVRSGA